MICRGCGISFETADPRKQRCVKNCGRTSQSHNGARTVARANHVPQFIGLDGEGCGYGPEHRYVVLSIGSKSYHLNGERLDTEFIFESLWTSFLENPQATYVGFALGYDFSQWFRDLPLNRALSLFNEIEKRKRTKSGPNPTPFPVYWKEWQFDILGSKRFRLRKGKKGSWLYVCDTFGFWQQSFLKAIDPKSWPDPICTSEEYAILEQGKADRSTATFSPEMLTYNVLENNVLARLMARLNQGLVAMGVRLRKTQWYGPGQAAQAWLKLIEAPKGITVQEATPKEVYNAARGSYFGGWFEITSHGHIPGISYEYDINSAYPSVIRSLPCLLHGRWVHSDGRTKAAPYQLIYGTYRGSAARLAAHLCRNSDGNIFRADTTGWAWRHEIEAARKAHLIDSVDIQESWTYHPCNCPPPIRAIANLYQDRIKHGKNSPEGKALKLVYNSAYGKFAQSIGSPTYSNPIYASLITAGCRAQILDAIATHPKRSLHVLMIATDALYFATPHPGLDIGSGLGQWEMTERENLTLMMPGVYWDDRSRAGLFTALKSRGVSAKHLSQVIGELDKQWQEWTPSEVWPEATISIDFQLVSPKSALNRHDWSKCGLVAHDTTHSLSANPVTKRQVSEVLCYTVPYTNRRYIVSKPYGSILNLVDLTLDPYVSVPYTKALGEQVLQGLPEIDTWNGPFNLMEELQ